MREMSGIMFFASVLALASFGTISSSNTEMLPYGIAYGQQLPPDLGSSSGLAAPGDNTTGPSGDNSTDIGVPGVPGGNLATPGQNSTDLGVPGSFGSQGGNITDLGPAAGNLPSTQVVPNSTSSTVPEFGPAISLILVVSIISAIVFSARNRLGF